MSHFSNVDASPDPSSLVATLDRIAVGLGAMKQYVATRLATLLAIDSVVLDIGCGAGHDLDLLAAHGLVAVGLDASTVMVDESRRRGHGALVRGDGATLPFADGAFDACRIERVLMHVDDPAEVLAEIYRVLRPGGFLAAFEPDWTTLTVATTSTCRWPDMGGRLEAQIEDAGFEVVDVVSERSRTRDPQGMPLRLAEPPGEDFFAEWTKTLVVAWRRLPT
jgi:SAM-dependent methyltransferase